MIGSARATARKQVALQRRATGSLLRDRAGIEEVRPMNVASTWVLPLVGTVGD
jgi:hypothetical protein